MMVTKQAKASLGKSPVSEKQLVHDFIERLEGLGHIFLYIDGVDAIHLVPKHWIQTPSEKKFKKEHADAINIFLAERDCESMTRYLAGQEDFA